MTATLMPTTTVDQYRDDWDYVQAAAVKQFGRFVDRVLAANVEAGRADYWAVSRIDDLVATIANVTFPTDNDVTVAYDLLARPIAQIKAMVVSDRLGLDATLRDSVAGACDTLLDLID